MATFFYQSGAGSTTQAYLGSVKTCPHCGGQKPKGEFKMVNGESVCVECQEEIKEEMLAQIVS